MCVCILGVRNWCVLCASLGYKKLVCVPCVYAGGRVGVCMLGAYSVYVGCGKILCVLGIHCISVGCRKLIS